MLTNVDYNMQNLRYLDNDNFDRTNHQMQSNAILTIFKNLLDFEASASLSQQQINNRGNFALSARSQTGNRADVLNYQFRPVLRHHFGNWADVTASYARGSTVNAGGGQQQLGGNIGSGDDDTYQVVFVSGSRFAKTPFSINYNKNESEYDSGQSNGTQSFTGDVSYVVNRKLRLTAQAGVDDNSFGGNSSSGNNRDGFRWKLGGTLTPSQRTNITGHVGERGFGQTFDVAVSHRHRRLTFALNYQEELRTNLQRQRELTLIPITDSAGLPVFDPFLNSNILTPVNTPSINEEVSLSKSLSVNMEYRMRRSDFNFTYYRTDRTFQSSLQGEETRGYSILWSRQLSPRLSAAFTFSSRETIQASGQNDNELYMFSPSLDYSLGPHSQLSINYQYVDSAGGRNNQFSNDFLENALTANLAIFY